jgi:hypothetical protein
MCTQHSPCSKIDDSKSCGKKDTTMFKLRLLEKGQTIRHEKVPLGKDMDLLLNGIVDLPSNLL